MCTWSAFLWLRTFWIPSSKARPCILLNALSDRLWFVILNHSWKSIQSGLKMLEVLSSLLLSKRCWFVKPCSTSAAKPQQNSLVNKKSCSAWHYMTPQNTYSGPMPIQPMQWTNYSCRAHKHSSGGFHRRMVLTKSVSCYKCYNAVSFFQSLDGRGGPSMVLFPKTSRIFASLFCTSECGQIFSRFFQDIFVMNFQRHCWHLMCCNMTVLGLPPAVSKVQ